MKKMTLKKLNNQGSTFVLAIIIIALVTTLALAILAASANNINMKNMDRASKDTFYTAETVMDEIRAGVGLDAMNNLGAAYEQILKTVIRTSPEGYAYAVSNDVANSEFKSEFIDRMLESMTDTYYNSFKFGTADKEKITGDDAVGVAVKTQVINYLNSYIKGYDAGTASISSVGAVKAYKNSDTGITWVIIIEDMVVSYIEDKNGEDYFAYVTSDLEIEFPNIVVDFSNTNRIKDFTEFALVADKDLNILGKWLTAEASIYAGNKLVVSSQEEGQAILEVKKPEGYENANVVCGGDNETDSGSIVVQGSTVHRAVLNINNADVWCSNLVTATKVSGGGKDATAGADITIGTDSDLYVKDDLTIEGQNSTINLNGNYYGYSYDGGDSVWGHTASSAIIVNGQNANLILGTNKLVLGGHAYVDLKTNGTEDYMMGEALSFKGDQEVYLMPAKYIAVGYDQQVPNPMPTTKWNELVTAANAGNIQLCNTNGFFAADLLDATNPYTVRQIGGAEGITYLFLNFKTNADAEAYIKRIIAGGGNADVQELKTKLNRYTNNLFQGTGTVRGAGEALNTAGIYTKGALLVTEDGSTAGVLNVTNDPKIDEDDLSFANDPGSVETYDEFILASLNFTNRYTIITHLLATIPWTEQKTTNNVTKEYTYIVDNAAVALQDKKDYAVAPEELTNTYIFDAILDRTLVINNTYNAKKDDPKYLKYGEGKLYTKVITNEPYTIPAQCVGGIVISTGTVTVQSNFEGLIISGENINIVGDATVKTNAALVDYFLSNELMFEGTTEKEDVPFKDYFYAYKNIAIADGSSEQIKVETVDYKDLINFNNWRKYEDSEPIQETETTE